MRAPPTIESLGATAGRCRVADGVEYWDQLGDRHREHRRHVAALLVIVAVIALIGALLHTGAFVAMLAVLPVLAVETFGARRSRPG